MKLFILRLQDATQTREIPDVISFVGEDSSGSFGILAGHARMITTLTFGLASFRIKPDKWKYLALPGAVLYFHNDVLTLSCRHFLMDDDYTRISLALKKQLLAEEKKLYRVKQNLHLMEEEVLKRLWEMERKDFGQYT